MFLVVGNAYTEVSCCLVLSTTAVSMKENTLFDGDIINISVDNHKSGRHSLTKAGVVILAVSGACFVGVYAVATPFLLPALRRICLPFVPATVSQVNNVFSALRGRSGTLLDIGSGDGRIVRDRFAFGQLTPYISISYGYSFRERFQLFKRHAQILTPALSAA